TVMAVLSPATSDRRRTGIAMQIDGVGRIIDPRRVGGTTRPSGSAAGSRFSLGLGQAASEATASLSAPNLAGLDAMLALQAVDDPELEQVLSEIDLRAAVELAKLDRRRG